MTALMIEKNRALFIRIMARYGLFLRRLLIDWWTTFLSFFVFWWLPWRITRKCDLELYIPTNKKFINWTKVIFSSYKIKTYYILPLKNIPYTRLTELEKKVLSLTG